MSNVKQLPWKSCLFKEVEYNGEPCLYTASKIDSRTIPKNLGWSYIRKSSSDYFDDLALGSAGGKFLRIRFYGTLLFNRDISAAEAKEIDYDEIVFSPVNHYADGKYKWADILNAAGQRKEN